MKNYKAHSPIFIIMNVIAYTVRMSVYTWEDLKENG
jgi:hypothetical protein